MRTFTPSVFVVASVLLGLAVLPALAQDTPPGTPAPTAAPAPSAPVDPRAVPRPGEPEARPTVPAVRPGGETSQPPIPPPIDPSRGIDMNYDEADLYSLLNYFSRITGRNFILSDVRELQGKKVTIISNKKVSPEAAYEAFLSALEVHGLTIVKVGDTHKVIKANTAQQSPGRPGEGGDIKATDQYITQIIPFDNIAVGDLREIVDNLVSPNAKVLAYVPSNTLIITDTGYNVRRIYDIVSKLDVAAPRSSLAIYPIVYADAEEIKTLIEELYGTVETAEPDARASRTAARSRRTARTPEPTTGTGVTAGEKANYISKVLSDERTNSLIALANETGHTVIQDLIGKIDIDVDPTSRSQIYVYRLEHAKAEDVVKVLEDLANGDSSRSAGRNAGNQSTVDPRLAAARAREAAAAATGTAATEGAESGGAIAAFESGLRIASDENTNSLVIIASRDDYEVIASVIRELDLKRKMVFVDAVILEMSATDTFKFNLAYHLPTIGDDFSGAVAGQFGTNSLGFSLASLTGLAFGIFGQSVQVPVVGPDGSAQIVDIPSFGVALEALKTNQLVNIVSSPSLLALDNEEATISVGRKVPFPINSGQSSFGTPLISFQREDVAITLEMTPRVNSENFVTLELKIGVQEIEGDTSGGSQAANGGFITSERKLETSALVADNQTIVLGGLIGTTETESESKIPVLGDLPILGALFRNKSKTARQTNLMVFLTPHIVDDEEDMEEIMRVKEAQRAEFLRRFYGKTQEQQFEEIRKLLQYSMNAVDQPSAFRGPTTISSTETLDGESISSDARNDLRDEVERGTNDAPGTLAGRLPPGEVEIDLGEPEPLPEESVAPEASEEATPSDAPAAPEEG